MVQTLARLGVPVIRTRASYYFDQYVLAALLGEIAPGMSAAFCAHPSAAQLRQVHLDYQKIKCSSYGGNTSTSYRSDYGLSMRGLDWLPGAASAGCGGQTKKASNGGKRAMIIVDAESGGSQGVLLLQLADLQRKNQKTISIPNPARLLEASSSAALRYSMTLGRNRYSWSKREETPNIHCNIRNESSRHSLHGGDS